VVRTPVIRGIGPRASPFVSITLGRSRRERLAAGNFRLRRASARSHVGSRSIPLALYLVLTKGAPLRIVGTTGLSGTLASVDSELTLLYRRLVGQPISLPGKIDNPYYLGVR
jgi:hypothetical protein